MASFLLDFIVFTELAFLFCLFVSKFAVDITRLAEVKFF